MQRYIRRNLRALFKKLSLSPECFKLTVLPELDERQLLLVHITLPLDERQHSFVQLWTKGNFPRPDDSKLLRHQQICFRFDGVVENYIVLVNFQYAQKKFLSRFTNSGFHSSFHKYL